MAKILMVLTGADSWTLKDGTKHPTGFWAEEAVLPYQALKAAGHEVTVATPGGVVPTPDAGSLSAQFTGGEDGARQMADAVAAMTELRSPVALADVSADDYDAVFYPGGHGPMEDLSEDADSGRLLTAALASGKPLAVVCHGPAALLAARSADGTSAGTGTSAFAGYRIAAFTNEEEIQGGLADKAKWLLEDRLAADGVLLDKAAPWTPHVVVDRNLITGQNPMSSAPLAAELLKALG